MKLEAHREAAVAGASEVALAITASTLKTIAVFLPVIFVGGITGVLFRDLALTVAFSLFASPLVALTLIPMLSGLLLREGMKSQIGSLTSVRNTYERMLRWAVRHRLFTLTAVLFFLVVSLSLYPEIGGQFMPEGISEEFYISVHSDGQNLMQMVEEVKRFLLDLSEFKVMQTKTGDEPGLLAGNGKGNSAEITVITGINVPGFQSDRQGNRRVPGL